MNLGDVCRARSHAFSSGAALVAAAVACVLAGTFCASRSSAQTPTEPSVVADPLERALVEDTPDVDPARAALPPDEHPIAPDAPIEDEAPASLDADEGARTEPPEVEASAPAREKRVRFTGFPFVFYIPETSVGFGFGISTSILTERPPESSSVRWFPSNITLGGAYTLNNQARILLTPELYLRRGNLVIDGQTEVRIYPDRFYGLGRGSDTDYQQYTDVSVRTSTVIRRQVAPGVYIGVVIDAANTRIRDVAEEDIGGEPVPTSPSTDFLGTGGVNGEVRSRVFGAGPAFVFDRRDYPLMSRSGYFVRLLASGFPGPSFSSNRFARLLLDVRGFVPFLNGRLVLAGQWVLTAATKGAPFNHLASVGGPVSLRSFPDGRFRDGMQTFAQTELRFPIVWRIRGAAHVGVGSVFGPFSREAPTRVLWAVGGGLRVVLDEDRRLAVRGDFVYGPEGSRVMAFVHEAF